MKLILTICLFIVVNAQDKYDAIDIDVAEVLKNDRLINSYAKCLINKGPCTAEIKRIKDKIPEILETNCAKCSDKQKQLGKSLVKEIKGKHPKTWTELVKFYDPQGKYQKAFSDFLN